jgi:chromosome segregation ATPase
LYYSQQVNHLDKWNYDNQIKDVAKISLHAKNACRTQSLKNMIGNIEGQYYKMMTLFHYLNEIRKINIHRENDLKEELKLANDSSNEFEEMCDNYINELDENENKIKELNSSLVTLKGQLKLSEADKKWLEDSYKNKINRVHLMYYLTNAFIAFLLVYLNYGMSIYTKIYKHYK